MNSKFSVQVKETHYHNSKYDNLERFISYFFQIDLVKSTNPQKVLEVGVGNKTVSNYLKQLGYDIDTCDFDKNLKPNYIADIRNLPFAENSYDTVMACEVLEHIPWVDVDKALEELERITKKYILISIPYLTLSSEIALSIPVIQKIFKTNILNVNLSIPLFFLTKPRSIEHYWEMGIKGFPRKKIKKLLESKFKIIKEFRPILNSYHRFFLLEKRKQ